MESNIDPKIRGIILEDLLGELFTNCFKICGLYIMKDPLIRLSYKQQMEIEKVERYLTSGLNLCDIDNELLIIVPDYLISTTKRISFRNLKLPQEIPDRFTEFLKQNQTAIELIAYIHMQNLLTK